MIVIPKEVCANLDAALDREWLVTNGLGGYASSSIAGANTRSYHGLLVAATEPGGSRLVLLSKLEEELTAGGVTYPLAANEHDGGAHPDGNQYLDHVRFEDMRPVFRYVVPGAIIEKTVWLEHGQNTSYIQYRCIQADHPFDLRITPLVTFRDFHRETQGFWHYHFGQRPINGGIELEAYPGAPPFRLLAEPSAGFQPEGAWYWRFRHRWEERRGLPSREDLYRPGSWTVRLQAGATVAIVASTEPLDSIDRDISQSLQRYQDRQQRLLNNSGISIDNDPFTRCLLLAADQFLLDESAGSDTVGGIVAGYPWFADRTRDTLISLPGLLLTTGREQAAANILRTYIHTIDNGMIPDSLLDPARRHEFSSADTGLWLFYAVDAYLNRTGNRALLREVYPALESMFRTYFNGNYRRLAMDSSDSLLRVTEAGTTWMNARLGGGPVTPRSGKPVEINALWYHAVRSLQGWGALAGRPIAGLDRLADRIQESFNRRFWNSDGGYLFDVVDGPDGDDATVRPNQIFAIALPHAVLEESRWRSVLETVNGHLLTSSGLRTLSPFDSRYRGRYNGDQGNREYASFQGSAWPWLLGFYASAQHKTHDDAAAGLRILSGIIPHLAQGAVGTIGEVFDGDLPQWPTGAVAQAISVGELLRAWVSLSHPERQQEEATVADARD